MRRRRYRSRRAARKPKARSKLTLTPSEQIAAIQAKVLDLEGALKTFKGVAACTTTLILNFERLKQDTVDWQTTLDSNLFTVLEFFNQVCKYSQELLELKSRVEVLQARLSRGLLGKVADFLFESDLTRPKGVSGKSDIELRAELLDLLTKATQAEDDLAKFLSDERVAHGDSILEISISRLDQLCTPEVIFEGIEQPKSDSDLRMRIVCNRFRANRENLVHAIDEYNRLIEEAWSRNYYQRAQSAYTRIMLLRQCIREASEYHSNKIEESLQWLREGLGEKILAIENSIQRQVAKTLGIQRRIDRDALKAAKANAYDEKIRKGASRVREVLKKSSNCPYCDCVLDDATNADHIIPVDLGGLSTVTNLVLVCIQCNSSKSNLTLREFCLKMGFDRDEVERRLIHLGKKI